MGQPFRYDWLRAKNRIMEAGQDPASFCLTCLPIAGMHLLNALLERADWEATYRVPDFDYEAHRDEIQDIVDATEVGLMTNCDDIIGDIVSQVTNNLTTIINNNSTTIINQEGACCYLENQPVFDPPPTDGIPTGEERDEICRSAQLAHDNGASFLDDTLTLGQAGTALSAGVVAAILGLYVLTIPFTLLLAVIGLILTAVTNLSVQQVKDDWDAIKKDIVCAIFSSPTAAFAKSEVDAVIDGASILGLSKELFKALYNQGQVNKIFNGEVGSTVGYLASYCDDCASDIYFLDFDWNDGEQEWNMVNNIGWTQTGEGQGSLEAAVHASGVFLANRAVLDKDAILAATGNASGQVDVLYMSCNFTNDNNVQVPGNSIFIKIAAVGGEIAVNGELFGDGDSEELETDPGLDAEIGTTGVQVGNNPVDNMAVQSWMTIDDCSMIVRVTAA